MQFANENIRANSKWSWLVPVAIYISVLAAALITSNIYWITGLLLLMAVLITTYLLIFNKSRLLSLTFFAIPLSVDFFDSGSMVALAFPSEAWILLLAAAVVTVFISRPVLSVSILYHPFTLILLMDLSWMMVTAFTSEMPLVSLKRIAIRGAFTLVLYLLVAHWARDVRNAYKLLMLYCTGLLIPVWHTLFRHWKYDFDPRTIFELPLPFFAEHTVYGAVIAFVLPFIILLAFSARKLGFSKTEVMIIRLTAFIFVIAEFLAFSRGSWASLLVALLMYVLIRWRIRFWQFLLLMMIASGAMWSYQDELYLLARENDNRSNRGAIGEHIMSAGNLTSDASNLERINRWRCALRMAEDRPLTGFGPGTFQFQYGPYQSVFEMTYISTVHGDKGNAHSEPLTCLSESGWPGLLLFILWQLASVAIGLRAIYRSRDMLSRVVLMGVLLGLITFYAHGLVNSFIDQVKMAGLVFPALAIIVACDAIHKKQKSKQYGIAAGKVE